MRVNPTKVLDHQSPCRAQIGPFFCWSHHSSAMILFFLHQQVNGQNVVGIKDKEIAKIIDEADQIVTVTVIPNFLFKHMTAKWVQNLVFCSRNAKSFNTKPITISACPAPWSRRRWITRYPTSKFLFVSTLSWDWKSVRKLESSSLFGIWLPWQTWQKSFMWLGTITISLAYCPLRTDANTSVVRKIWKIQQMFVTVWKSLSARMQILLCKLHFLSQNMKIYILLFLNPRRKVSLLITTRRQYNATKFKTKNYIFTKLSCPFATPTKPIFAWALVEEERNTRYAQ